MRLLSIESSLRCLTRRSVALSSECCESESSSATLPPSPRPSSTVTCDDSQYSTAIRAWNAPCTRRKMHQGMHRGMHHGMHRGDALAAHGALGVITR